MLEESSFDIELSLDLETTDPADHPHGKTAEVAITLCINKIDIARAARLDSKTYD
jgi:hypothetical protein